MKKRRIIGLILAFAMLAPCLVSCRCRPAPVRSVRESGSVPDEAVSVPRSSRGYPTFDLLSAVGGMGMTYETGVQIEIYLNSAPKTVFDYIGANPQSVVIADPDIAELQGGMLIPKKQGVTYITCNYGNVIRNHNVVVYGGAETVTAWQINNTSSDTFVGYVGQRYRITVSNSANCDITDLKLTASTDYDEVEAEDLITLGEDGTLELVGVGECEIRIRSVTNMLDQGVKIKVSSTFEDRTLGNAVDNWFNTHINLMQAGVYTERELAMVDSLVFGELIAVNETDWRSVLPSLKTVVFDLSDGGYCPSEYRIGAGELKYCFVGSPNRAYDLQITATGRRSLELELENLALSPRESACIDLSDIPSSEIGFKGTCTLRAADASARHSGDGSTAIMANELTVTLYGGARVNVLGGNGTSVGFSGTRNGGNGIVAMGDLSLRSDSEYQKAVLNVFGGNGGHAYDTGTSGGHGGVGMQAKMLTVSGPISCEISGGNGGNGVKGIGYSNAASSGSAGGDAQNGKAGSDGASGTKGGDGGNGGIGLFADGITTVDSAKLHCQGGNGGNGAAGGNGQSGGQGGKGGRTIGLSLFQKEKNAGNGGKGGSGGNGGDGGHAGSGALAIRIPQKNLYMLASGSDITMVHGYGGVAGKGGDGGSGGNGGDGGDDKDGGIFFTEGPVEGAGGAGGSGGSGGRAGYPATPVTPYGVANEYAPSNPNETSVPAGSNGSQGSSGSRGHYGDKK